MKCQGGECLADESEFVNQSILANDMLDWYSNYVVILRRLNSGESVRLFDDFCGGGAVSEGVRRAGGAPFGLDIEDQPAYKTPFRPSVSHRGMVLIGVLCASCRRGTG